MLAIVKARFLETNPLSQAQKPLNIRSISQKFILCQNNFNMSNCYFFWENLGLKTPNSFKRTTAIFPKTFLINVFSLLYIKEKNDIAKAPNL